MHRASLSLRINDDVPLPHQWSRSERSNASEEAMEEPGSSPDHDHAIVVEVRGGAHNRGLDDARRRMRQQPCSRPIRHRSVRGPRHSLRHY